MAPSKWHLSLVASCKVDRASDLDGVRRTGCQLLPQLYSQADLFGTPHTVQESRRAAKIVARGSGDLPSLDSGARMGSEDMLPNEEVIRRLRLLGQPATLFGEVCCSTSSSLVLLRPAVAQSCTQSSDLLTFKSAGLTCCLLAADSIVP